MKRLFKEERQDMHMERMNAINAKYKGQNIFMISILTSLHEGKKQSS